MQWKKEEEDFLKILEQTCISLSRDYHKTYFNLQSTQSKLRIPAIIIGSFTGVASFGTATFPDEHHSTVAIIVGIVNVCIAILSTVESYFKLGENINLTASASVQLRKLANDINKELCIDDTVRETSGINFLRDCYTRYQQILSGAPILRQFKAYKVESQSNTQRKGILKNMIEYFTPSNMSQNTSARTSLEETKLRQQLQQMKFYTRKADAGTSTEAIPSSPPEYILTKPPIAIAHKIDIEDYNDVELDTTRTFTF